MGASWSVADIPSQAGKTVIVTGANCGIGFYTALEMGRAGATVILVCRNAERANAAADKMRAAVPTATFEVAIVDVSSVADVKKFAAAFNKRDIALDTLINNAGIMAIPEHTLTAEGFESQWATNHVGHFALTGLLIPSLKRSSAPRVVAVSSSAADMAKGRAPNMTTANVDFTGTPASYDPFTIYCDTKLANQLHMLEFNGRYPDIPMVACHPGGTNTELQKHAFNNMVMRLLMMPTASGARYTLRAATEAGLAAGAYMGPYFYLSGAAVPVGQPKAAKDKELAATLWAASVKATGVDY
jgi:NAD(P)-dependent dehydrogenase (short-subunit alcohol dehydrogenase family)